MAYCCSQTCVPSEDDGCYCIPHQQQCKRRSRLEKQDIVAHLNNKPDIVRRSIQLTRHHRDVNNTKKGRPIVQEGGEAKMWRYSHFLNPSLSASIPSLKVTQDTIGPYLSSHSNLKMQETKIIRDDLWMADSRYYTENRGPILSIHGKETEWIFTYKEFLKLDDEGEPIEVKHEDYSLFYPRVEDLFIYEEIEPFSATTRSKQVKQMKLKNQGTTAVRYQWLRTPPTRAMRKILGRPGSVVNLEKFQPPENEPYFWKDTCFEFHFRELPGVILPGQSILFPIMFRPRRPGYFHEKLYLLTHPRLSDEEDRVYCLKLSGVCMNPECPLPHSNSSKFGKPVSITSSQISKKIKSQMLEHEASDIVHSILDNVLYDFYKPKRTLSMGKITVEKIFQTHNKGLNYHFGAAEAGLETVRKLVISLVPKNQIVDKEQVCPLSIQALYRELTSEPPATEYFWKNFKSLETEEKLEELSKSTRTLSNSRVIAWPTIQSRIYSSCYTTMVGMVYEIVARLANIDFYAVNEDLDNVLKAEIKERLTQRKTIEMMKAKGLETSDVDVNNNGNNAGLILVSSASGRGDFSRSNLKSSRTTTNSTTRYFSTTSGEVADDEGYTNESYDEDDEEDEGRDIDRKMNQSLTLSISTQGKDKDKNKNKDKDKDKENNNDNDNGNEPDAVVSVSDEEILQELTILKKKKETQEKRVLFETLFGCGVERMMSVVDSYKAMYDYNSSDAVRPCQGTACIKPIN